MTKTLGSIFDRKSITEEQNWVIVKNGQIVEHYLLFQDAVKDKRGHLMTKEFWDTYYVNKPQY